jgi:hypothetical protein
MTIVASSKREHDRLLLIVTCVSACRTLVWEEFPGAAEGDNWTEAPKVSLNLLL